jgi:cytochrome c-type biogenesis protein CcmH/NrfF
LPRYLCFDRAGRWGLIVLMGLMLIAPASAEFDPVEHKIATSAILCDCGCHPQSVHDCACGRAAQMRQEMAALIESGPPDGDGSGMTGEELIAYYVSLHGEQVRISPTADGFNLIVWIGPFIVLFAGTALLVLMLRRWKAAHPVEVGGPPVEIDPDDPYLKRLQSDLRELE